MRTLHALKRLASVTLIAVILFTTALSSGGCYTQKVEVGKGANEGTEKQFQQWFVLWGLVPMTKVEPDVKAYIGADADYTVVTQFTAIDCVIGFFTNIVTIGPKTVTVQK